MLISDKIIGRLSLYRRLLGELEHDGRGNVYSHELASLTGYSAAQIRRDIMNIGYSGNPNRGYDIHELVASIADFLDPPGRQYAGLVGVGNLGRAILAYFSGRRPKLDIAAAFDVDPQKFGRVIHGCRCFSMEELRVIVEEKEISIGIIAVPADQARAVADDLVKTGRQGNSQFCADTPPCAVNGVC